MIKEAALSVLQHARHTAPITGIVLVGTLAAPLADGAPGDLDPSFGDAGRLEIDDLGPVWSLDLEADGDGFLAGGYESYCWYDEFCTHAFAHPFSSSGELDVDYTHPDLPDSVILDTARQADGKTVAVGSSRGGLSVFRLMPNGTLDSTFGEGGVAEYGASAAMAVVLEPDGRIVVAASRDGRLLVVRLLEDGTLDKGFGKDGVVIGPENRGRAQLARTPAGGYRATAATSVGVPPDQPLCRVIALTPDGTLDQSFGTGGSIDVAPDETGFIDCESLAIQANGRLLVAGSADEGGLLVRLLPDGSPDDTFSAPAVSEQMGRATALTFDTEGKVLVAGVGPSGVAGAVVARLSADGALDETYGNAGTTWVYLQSEPYATVINDMAAGANGSLTVGGGHGGSQRPFVARLSGNGSADAAGVVSLTRGDVVAPESESQAIVTVRRTGGRAGAVSVAYRTVPDAQEENRATPGIDYEAVTGTLTWADGDMTDREVAIPIGADPTPEGVESFSLTIDSMQGGAGFGAQATRVEIPADGAPAGQLIFRLGPREVREGHNLEVWVERAYYGAGAVSVTITPSGAASAGDDYVLQPSMLTWADGEMGEKSIVISARDDNVDNEPPEQLTLALTNPSGGAILGAEASASLSIVDSPPEVTSGGGSFGWASLLALCAAAVRRFARTGRASAPG